VNPEKERLMVPQNVLAKIDAGRLQAVGELAEFLRIPSVSTDPRHATDVRRAAEWVVRRLETLGFQARLHETGKHPVVSAVCVRDPGLPTLLIYGHYDVQPPDPLDEWVSPPFSPTVRDGFMYARGATDNKGQSLTYLRAADAVLRTEGHLPLNIKVLMEGEEEIGSPSLARFFEEHGEDLRADAVAISDGSQFASGIPAITYGLRGLSYLQVEVQGPRFDLHSGSFGGVVVNPVQVLAEMLARLKKPDDTVAIPSFYDDVVELEPREREEMASLPFDEAELREYLGVDVLVGEPGYTPMERRWARPTLDVNGIWGGFSGEGAKTIIPARAGAKVSMRLVPNQRTATIDRLFETFIQSLAPSGVQVKVTGIHGNDPVLISRDEPGVQAAARAIEIGFGKRPVFIREGGSIPIVTLFKETLGMQNILLLGWGSPDDGSHSPNERFSVEDFHRGIRSAAALFYEIPAALGT
jgi:acetylornithine deacetylase/succinyl-diaminopimelate desuccinylase-like protein